VNGLQNYVLGLGDDCLILSHRLAEWTTRAPELEEDVALANIALDLLGQARMLLAYAGSLDGRSEDDLAYLREEREFRNCQLVELENGDFAQTIARLLCFSTYQLALYERLTGSADATVAAIAAKGVKEVAYHRDHASQWMLRLGDGTPESHQRAVAGLAAVWPYTFELFSEDDWHQLADIAVNPADLRPAWESYLDSVLSEATLERPADDGWRPTGGRRGVHTEAMGYLLAESQHLHRAYPGATW
jgi:ring-1,2-phenylacetyl-CoA epoxidase subunit PaaC